MYSCYSQLLMKQLWSKLQTHMEKRSTSLKEQLASITPLAEDLRLKKEERLKQFAEIRAQIEKINGEISGYNHHINTMIGSLTLEEQDLSLRNLNECQTHLRNLQKEKVWVHYDFYHCTVNLWSLAFWYESATSELMQNFQIKV